MNISEHQVTLTELEKKMENLSNSINEIQVTQKQHGQQIKTQNLSARLEAVEKKQDEVVKLLTGLRSELAGISSGMARRDSLMLGSGVVSGLTSLRRDSLILDPTGRRDSLILGSEGYIGRNGNIPVMEVEPWEPTHEVQEVIDRLLERQFLLSPWVREKRLRNQLRLVLKDHLEAGPKRRSTVTKIVHDAHQVYPVWRNQMRDVMFENWEKVQEIDPKESAEIIYAQFKKPRFPDEQEATNLYGEHMVEVGQYLKRKAIERAERSGKHNYNPVTVTNSKFWYEVRKKINEVLEQEKAAGNKRASQNEDDSDNEAGHAVITPQTSLDTEDEDCYETVKRNGHMEMDVKVKMNGRKPKTKSV
eukprot:TRINITY_DN21527_c0_g1_i1.p1 TRINITY_DN21527_c0_g1~~TRINITY_DN21527_c0_g1_i1.p1  ORF type:complete len:361 (+),score=99.86 TRINITY_DN21527_c0_g1_i1:295-1377(+)